MMVYYLHKATKEAAAQFILQPQFHDNPQYICEWVIAIALQSCSNASIDWQFWVHEYINDY